MDDEFDDDILSRRERQRLERQDVNSKPTFITLRTTAVMVLVALLLGWLVVSWFSRAASSTEALDSPAQTLENTDSDAEPRPLEQAPEQASPPGQQAGHAEANTAQGQEAPGGGIVYVHVTGAVGDPGLVELDAGSRINDAIEQAGGLDQEAATDAVNLAAEVIDGMLIWVPTVNELAEEELTPPLALEPVTHHSGGISPNSSGGSGADSSEPLVNINTGDAEELQKLPGIGPALSERIIDYRESQGGFGSLEELAGVSGIGPAILSNVEEKVTW